MKLDDILKDIINVEVNPESGETIVTTKDGMKYRVPDQEAKKDSIKRKLANAIPDEALAAGQGLGKGATLLNVGSDLDEIEKKSPGLAYLGRLVGAGSSIAAPATKGLQALRGLKTADKATQKSDVEKYAERAGELMRQRKMKKEQEKPKEFKEETGVSRLQEAINRSDEGAVPGTEKFAEFLGKEMGRRDAGIAKRSLKEGDLNKAQSQVSKLEKELNEAVKQLERLRNEK